MKRFKSGRTKLKRLTKKFSYLKELFIFFALAVFIWSRFHEYMHISVLKYFGYEYNLRWNIFIPQVHCIGCDLNNISQMFLYAFFPYIIDILAVIFGILFYRHKIMRYLMHFGYFDIISNYFSMLIALFYGTANDFLNLIRMGFFPFVIAFFILSTLLWFPKNKGLLVDYIRRFKKAFEA